MAERKPRTARAVTRAHDGFRLSRAPIDFAIVALAVLVVGVAVSSLGWRVYHDSPILLYVGFMIERYGAVPFRDLFEMNLPLTDLAFALIGSLTGFADVGVRLVDLGLLAATLGSLAWAARRFGGRVGFGAPLLYAALYLHEAALHGLQRESMMAVPLAGALAVLAPGGGSPVWRRSLLAGNLLGIAAAIKPAMAIDLVPVLAYLFWLDRRSEPGEKRSRMAGARALGAGALGFVLPLLATAAYLLVTGAWTAFLDIYTGYLPLYARLGALHETLSDAKRPAYLWAGLWAMGGYRAWWLPAAAGLALAFAAHARGSVERGYVALLAGLLVAHTLAPALGGQFWPYHWYPFLLVMAFAVTLAWSAGVKTLPRALREGLPLFAVVAIALWVRPPAALEVQLAGGTVDTPLRSRIDSIAAYLRENLRPGDTVQPLDWTGGAVHAMLIARARLATPFVYDFHFYHHVSTPYVQGLRRRFMASLGRAAPRFVIVIETQKPWVQGEDTTTRFPELVRYLVAHYQVGLQGDGYAVLVRNP